MRRRRSLGGCEEIVSERRVLWRRSALTRPRANDSRADVEAVTLEGGDPAGLNRDQALDEGEQDVRVERLQRIYDKLSLDCRAPRAAYRESYAVCGPFHPSHVEIWPKQPRLAVRAHVCLNNRKTSELRGRTAQDMRHTFIPSNTLVLYWKQELAGSRLSGP